MKWPIHREEVSSLGQAIFSFHGLPSRRRIRVVRCRCIYRQHPEVVRRSGSGGRGFAPHEQ